MLEVEAEVVGQVDQLLQMQEVLVEVVMVLMGHILDQLMLPLELQTQVVGVAVHLVHQIQMEEQEEVV
jgi:hypothetical protein